MKIQIREVVLPSILACLLLSGGNRLLPQDNTITWLGYEEAVREAKRTRKPLLVEFRCEP